MPRSVVVRSIEHSVCFGVYEGARQIGFARVITDQVTVAFVSDVFVLEPWRGRGLGDAHGLYRRVGFTPPAHPERLMEKVHPDPYRDRS